VVERRTLVAGEIKRLSVAVLVDPPYKMVKAADGTEEKVPSPRPQAELEKLRSLVMKAVGFNAARGDEVEVAELAFDTSSLDRERVVAEQAERTAFWWSLVRPAVTALLVLVLILFGLRPLLRALRRPRPPGLPGVPQPALDDAALLARLKAGSVAALKPAQAAALQSQETLRDQVAALARTHPDQVAQLLRTWMGNRRA
jgi:flagellar M-ring protein FliF